MPKCIKKILDQNLTYDKLLAAYQQVRKGKRMREDAILFHLKYEDYLKMIQKKLYEETYQFGTYQKFYVYEPKKREILAAPYRDRIVHTWYVKNFLETIFVPTFISTSYACIQNRGTHACAIAVKHTIRNLYHSPQYQGAYIIKMDVKKFFKNINRTILLNIIQRKVKDEKMIRLTAKILESARDFDSIPGVGIPIGNYTSQIFANIYLNELDQYAKHTLKCRYYYRYMDDICVIVSSKEKAKYILEKLTQFLREKLSLELNSKTNIFKISQGVNFVGYKIGMKYVRIRNSSKKRLVSKLKLIEKKLQAQEIFVQDAKKLLAGNYGHMQIADIHGISKKYFYEDV